MDEITKEDLELVHGFALEWDYYISRDGEGKWNVGCQALDLASGLTLQEAFAYVRKASEWEKKRFSGER